MNQERKGNSRGSNSGRRSFGGNRSGGGFRGNRSGGGRSFGGNNFSSGPREMHKATCSECGKECEVPFKPTQGKPVFCKECFSKKKRF